MTLIGWLCVLAYGIVGLGTWAVLKREWRDR